MKITKIIEFSAAHQLPNEECYGKCSNIHGHTYKLEVTVKGEINNKGWVMNFKELKEIVMELINKYDHSMLNDHKEFNKIPTAEVMVQHIFEYIESRLYKIHPIIIQLIKVRLWETPTSYAELEV